MEEPKIDIAEEKETPIPASAEKSAEEETKKVDEEIRKKEEHLANLNKAIAEENERIREARLTRRQEVQPQKDELQIDLEDPSAKAWDKHIRESVDPMKAELEAEKTEVRTFALQKFLADKPALAQKPEKVKELIATYERIRVATERTSEGVLLDLNKAYAALHADELIAAARNQRIEKAEADSTFSDIAVSRGASAYQTPKEKSSAPKLNSEQKQLLAKWGMTPEEWAAVYEKHGSK